ncbi:MAG: exonuclease domain-containing protein [Planctomycetaceae bacterium]
MPAPLWIAFDTETTGLEAGSRMVELAAVAFTLDGEIRDGFASLIDPIMPMPADVVRVHGLDSGALAGQATAADVLRRFLDWLPGGAVLVAHNAGYDMNILGWELERCGLDWPSHHVVDSGRLARALGETRNCRLQTLVAHHGWILPGQPHRAECDAEAVRRLVMHALSRKLHLERPDLFIGRAFKGSWRYPRKLPESMAPLVEAIETGERVRLSYRDGRGSVTHRQITPFGLAEVKGGVQFHGWCHARGARRNFLASRVLELGRP